MSGNDFHDRFVMPIEQQWERLGWLRIPLGVAWFAGGIFFAYHLTEDALEIPYEDRVAERDAEIADRIPAGAQLIEIIKGDPPADGMFGAFDFDDWKDGLEFTYGVGGRCYQQRMERNFLLISDRIMEIECPVTGAISGS